MKTVPGARVRQALRIAMALAFSLLGLALLPVLALPYSTLDWVDFDPAYKESLSAPSVPLPTVGGSGIPCAELLAPGAKMAAEVNGQPIGQEAFERELAQFRQAWESLSSALGDQERQVPEPSFSSQVLDLLIDDALVQQAAVQAGITVDKDEVQARMAEEVFQGGGPEVFQAWLAETGQTWQEFEQGTCQDLLRKAVREHITGGGSAGPTDPDTREAAEVFAFEQWLDTRREAAEIKLYVDTGP